MGNKGQSIVEITLIVPLLLIALYIPIDFGVALLMMNQTQTATRDVARIASGTPDSSWNATTLQNTLRSRIPTYLQVVSTSVTKRTTNPANCFQNVTATATIRYTYFWYRAMNLFGANIPPTRDIVRSTQMAYSFQSVNASSVSTLCTAA